MKHPIKIDDLGVPLFLETSNFVLTKKGVETVTVQDGLLSNVVNDWWIGTQPAMFIYKKPTLQKEGTWSPTRPGRATKLTAGGGRTAWHRKKQQKKRGKRRAEVPLR